VNASAYVFTRCFPRSCDASSIICLVFLLRNRFANDASISDVRLIIDDGHSPALTIDESVDLPGIEFSSFLSGFACRFSCVSIVSTCCCFVGEVDVFSFLFVYCFWLYKCLIFSGACIVSPIPTLGLPPLPGYDFGVGGGCTVHRSF
jgi:hypothetical protein